MPYSKARSKSLIVFSISSDIGVALAKSRLAQGWRVFGTYRQHSDAVAELDRLGAIMLPADFQSRASLGQACSQLNTLNAGWDELVVAPGSLEPIGPFDSVDFESWADSIQVNFVNQLYIIHRMLISRHPDALVILFAGSGTNGTADRFSAYTVSKIALIKMAELLDSEISDARFVVVGPGWVKTKIHEQTIDAQSHAGQAYEETNRRLLTNDFVPMASVIDCLDWISAQDKSTVSGRNISVSHDRWDESTFAALLRASPAAGKLRRDSNTLLNRSKN
jgi:NAD(P)-dependent dehydrogenase (short-subunit alcohol dehydrogenase family)